MSPMQSKSHVSCNIQPFWQFVKTIRVLDLQEPPLGGTVIYNFSPQHLARLLSQSGQRNTLPTNIRESTCLWHRPCEINTQQVPWTSCLPWSTPGPRTDGCRAASACPSPRRRWRARMSGSTRGVTWCDCGRGGSLSPWKDGESIWNTFQNIWVTVTLCLEWG